MERAVRRESATALNDRAFQLQKLGKHEEAEPLLRRALELKPDYAYALYNLGWSLVAQGKARDALGPLSRSAELQPGRWEPLQRLSEAYALLGETDKAREYEEKAKDVRGGARGKATPALRNARKPHPPVVALISESAYFDSLNRREIRARQQELQRQVSEAGR